MARQRRPKRAAGDYSPGHIDAHLIREVAGWPSPATPQHIYDSVQGCFLRHQPSGYLGLYAILPGRNKRERVAFTDRYGRRTDARCIFDPEHPMTWGKTTKEIRRLQGKAVEGHDFSAERQAKRAVPTLNDALDPKLEGSYAEDVIACADDPESVHHRSGQATLSRLEQFREAWGGTLKLSEIDAEKVRRWSRQRRIRDQVSYDTIERDLTALRAMLQFYVDAGRLKVHPVGRLKREKRDTSIKRVRAFTAEEEAAIWKAAEARDEKARRGRASGNEWRAKRGYEFLPSLEGRYTDMLLPAMKIARLTGLRRGEQFALQWSDVDLHRGTITVRREKAKDFERREIPLSQEAVSVLRRWRMQTGGKGPIFGHANGRAVTNLKRGFYALLEVADVKRTNGNGQRVSWHSWRHTFATSLIHRGVDVATVKRLLGHSSVSTVIDRYLDTDEKRMTEAIKRLDNSS